MENIYEEKARASYFKSLLNQSISHGTARLEDLIPTFAGVLKKLDPDSFSAWKKYYEYWFSRSDEDRYEALESLFNKLNDCTFSYNNENNTTFYFGSHPGDGSDYGFWEYDE